MADETLGALITAIVASLLTYAVWQPIYDLNPIGNVILVLFDVVTWIAFVLSVLKS
jgi:hypothetical protein